MVLLRLCGRAEYFVLDKFLDHLMVVDDHLVVAVELYLDSVLLRADQRGLAGHLDQLRRVRLLVVLVDLYLLAVAVRTKRPLVQLLQFPIGGGVAEVVDFAETGEGVHQLCISLLVLKELVSDNGLFQDLILLVVYNVWNQKVKDVFDVDLLELVL